MQPAGTDEAPITVTECLSLRCGLPFFVGWPIAGAAIFGIQALIVAVTNPEDSYLVAGLLLATAIVLAGVAQPYASRRLSILVRTLLEAAYWTDQGARLHAQQQLALDQVFEQRGTVISGFAFALVVAPGLAFALRAVGFPLALGSFGIFCVETTAFLAGMALSRSWPILKLFHRLAGLQLKPQAFIYARNEILLFARIAGELAGIVVLAYALAFSAIIASPVSIPTGVTIGYMSFGGVVTTSLFLMPQLQVSQLVRRNKAYILDTLARELDHAYASAMARAEPVHIASLSQVFAALLAVRAVPEWVLLDPRLIAGFLISVGLQMGVGILQLRMNG